MNQMESIIKKIELLNLNQNWQDILSNWLRTELTYTSNNIEGNTLSLIETSLVINDKQSVSGKSLREVNEAINHAIAWDYITDILSKKELKVLTIDDILKLHSLVLNNIEENQKGKFRNVQVRIAGSNTILPNPLKVDYLMKDCINKINVFNSNNLSDIIKLAILTHLEIVKIHPFTDGNGRTSRLIMNTILKHYNLPPISVDPKNRELYLASLEKSDIIESQEFIDFMLLQYNQNLDKYLATFD
jgi:Fic family protein